MIKVKVSRKKRLEKNTISFNKAECKKLIRLINYFSRKEIDYNNMEIISSKLIKLPIHVHITLLRLMIHSDSMELRDNFMAIAAYREYRKYLTNNIGKKYRQPAMTFLKRKCKPCLVKKPDIDCEWFVHRMIGECPEKEISCTRMDFLELSEEKQIEWLMGLMCHLNKK
jgi:hypothetical protein